jgi:O-antigen/teichoic acid export membrane protein
VLGTSLAALVDMRLAADRQFTWIIVRVVAMSVVRLALLPLFRESGSREIWLFLLGGGGAALSGLVVTALAPRAVDGHWRLHPFPADTREIVHFSLVNYGADLAARAPLFALPVVVLTNVGATENANFYVAFQITTLVFLIPMTIGQVVLIEGGRALQHAASQARLALVATVGLMAAASVGTWLLSDLVVSLYGPEYAKAADVLPILMVAGVPWAVTSIALAELRVRGSHVGTTIVTVAFAAGVLLPALVLVPSQGADGAVTAWVVGNVLAAVVGAAAARVGRGGRGSGHAMARLGPERKEVQRAVLSEAE